MCTFQAAEQVHALRAIIRRVIDFEQLVPELQNSRIPEFQFVQLSQTSGRSDASPRKV